MFSSGVAPRTINPVQYPEHVTRDEIGDLLGALHQSFEADAQNSMKKRDACRFPYIHWDRHRLDAIASKEMATCTEAVKLSLGGNTATLATACEARSNASAYATYKTDHHLDEEDRLTFMGVLFAMSPEMKTVYVKRGSRYPNLYWDIGELRVYGYMMF